MAAYLAATNYKEFSSAGMVRVFFVLFFLLVFIYVFLNSFTVGLCKHTGPIVAFLLFCMHCIHAAHQKWTFVL
jgi:hypothetical protein